MCHLFSRLLRSISGDSPFECVCKEKFEGGLCESARNICSLESSVCGPNGLCELLVESTADWAYTFQCRCLDGFSQHPQTQVYFLEVLLKQKKLQRKSPKLKKKLTKSFYSLGMFSMQLLISPLYGTITSPFNF